MTRQKSGQDAKRERGDKRANVGTQERKQKKDTRNEEMVQSRKKERKKGERQQGKRRERRKQDRRGTGRETKTDKMKCKDIGKKTREVDK